MKMGTIETCRVCLLERNCLILIPLSNAIDMNIGEPIVIREILNYCFDVKLEKDGKPEYLCDTCFKDAVTSYSFKEMFLRSDKFLNDEFNGLLERADCEVSNGDIESQTEHMLVQKEEVEDLSFNENYEYADNHCDKDRNDDIHDTEKVFLKFQEDEDEKGSESYREEGLNTVENNFSCPNDDIFVPDESEDSLFEELQFLHTGTRSPNAKKFKMQDKNFFEDKIITPTKVEMNNQCSIDDCTFTIDNPLALKYHELRHEAETHVEHTTPECSHCDATYVSKEQLIDHWMDEHSGLFGCTMCNYYTENRKAYEEHQRREHNDYDDDDYVMSEAAATTTTSGDFMMCEVCGTRCETLRILELHMKTHTAAAHEYRCKMCERVFTHRATLHVHKKVHHSGREFVCEICGTAVPTVFRLREHMRSHSEFRGHGCDRCGQKFKTQSQLRKHKKNVHIAVREYRCNVCMKQFLTKYHMERHLRSHTGLKHGCEYCDKSYVELDDLQKHMRTDHFKM